MHRSILRTIPSAAAKSASRPLSTTIIARASKPAHEPASSQGHTVDKAHTTLHKDSDIQSAGVRAGQDAKNKAETKTSGEDEPFDAARQGQTGGESKGHGATGSFRDQVGGQDEPQKGAGAVKGGSETAAGYNITETVANKVKDGFNSLKQMRSDGRNFSTSTRVLNGTTPRADAEGARKPVDTSVHSDQNPHLKHTSGGSQGQPGKGNASPDPSLPSKNKQVNTAESKGARSFSTSTRALADPNTPAGNASISGQKEAQSQTGLKQQPRAGDNVEHGGATGAPSSGSAGFPEGNAHPASGTATPDPGLSRGEQQTAKKANQTRSFSTSTRALADPNTPSTDAPIHGQKVAQSQAGLKQQPRAGDSVQHGGAAGSPSQGSSGAPESSPNPASGTAAPDPGLPKKEKEGANRDGMGIRNFSTSTRAFSDVPQAKAIPPEAAKAGYNAPPTALPSSLKSAYKEVDPNAVQSPDAGMKASSEIPYSSSAADPPNQALRKAVLEGTMPEMNPQPDVPGTETGRQGIDEAWKHRK